MRLRALEPEDLSALYEIENDMDVWQYGTTNTPISMYTLRQYIATCKNDIFEDNQLRLAVEDENVLIGLVDLVNFNPMHHRAEVGIVIRKDFRAQGKGRETLVLLEHYARHVIGLHQLYAIVAAENMVAVKMFEESGYARSVILKDWLFSPAGNARDAILFQRFCL